MIYSPRMIQARTKIRKMEQTGQDTRSLNKILFNARRLGLSVCFISGSLLSFIFGILLIMNRVVRVLKKRSHFNYAGHPYQFFSILPPFATVFKVLRTLRYTRLYCTTSETLWPTGRIDEHRRPATI